MLLKASRGIEPRPRRRSAAWRPCTTGLIQIVVALLLAFIGMVLLAPIYISLLQRLGFGKQIRIDGPEAHYGKAGTPTMGGMLVVGVVLFLAMALRIEDAATLTPMLTLMGVGILGAVDDYVNVRDRHRHARPLEAGLADGGGDPGRPSTSGATST